MKLTISYSLQALKNGEILNELGLEAGLAGERGLRLLFVLSFIFPSHFLHQGKLQADMSTVNYMVYRNGIDHQK